MSHSPSPPSYRVALPRTSAVVFAWDQLPALRRLLPAILASPIDEILLIYGGDDGSREYVATLADPRLRPCFEAERQGKFRSFNRALELVRGEIVFLVSGDIRISPEVFARLEAHLTGDVVAAFPRVVPSNTGTFVGGLGGKLWDLHDAQLADCAPLGLPAHGGELQAFRRSALEPLPGVVNDDAYLCLRAIEKGYRVDYAREVEIQNTVPETLGEFLEQRSRVNYGHAQLLVMGHEPFTFDGLARRHLALFLRVFWRGLLAHPEGAWRIPLLAGLELIAVSMGRRDLRRRRDRTVWTLVRSGRGRPGAAPEFSSPGK